MKKILLATTLLAATTGFAAAEVTLSGDARMGIISNFDLALADDPLTLTINEALIDESDLQFTSRARVKFTLSGSTDGGLEFGASFRAQDAVGASKGTAGSVFISGAFGKLSMGDVDDAANTAIGQVSGVGLTGLGDLNEVSYIGGGNDPTALYEYSTGDLSVYLSVTNPTIVASPASSLVAYSAAAKYVLGDYTVSLGYENNDAGTDHVLIGATASFGAATVKAIYGSASGVADGDQYALSVDYKADALTVTAFYSNKDITVGILPFAVQEAYGLGASYDLGGGASVVGGYSHNETVNQDAFDLGVSMSF
jgi:outer membrane protein OmpU